MWRRIGHSIPRLRSGIRRQGGASLRTRGRPNEAFRATVGTEVEHVGIAEPLGLAPRDGAACATVAMQQQASAFIRHAPREFLAQSSERDIDRVGEVPALELVRRTHIDDERARLKLLSGDRCRHEGGPLQG